MARSRAGGGRRVLAVSDECRPTLVGRTQTIGRIGVLAEAVRFELTDGLPRRWFSRPVHSTALARFLSFRGNDLPEKVESVAHVYPLVTLHWLVLMAVGVALSGCSRVGAYAAWRNSSPPGGGEKDFQGRVGNNKGLIGRNLPPRRPSDSVRSLLRSAVAEAI